jgi:hypothetical protein
MKLGGKVAVITGGNSGIGLATAREFKANGAKVAIFGRNQQTLKHAAAGLGGEVLAVQGDVRKLADLERLFELQRSSARLTFSSPTPASRNLRPWPFSRRSCSTNSVTYSSRACFLRCRRRCLICATARRSYSSGRAIRTRWAAPGESFNSSAPQS